MSILKVVDLKKSYGKLEVLKGINFEIEEPNILALVGPNGSGKTTLLNVMTYLLKPDSGVVELLGFPHHKVDVFKHVAYLKDNRVLYPYLTGYDHLKYIQSIQKLPMARIDEVIDEIGIRDYVKRKTGSYSLGMKQHLLFAMAIMNHPKLLLLDEPLTGLDPTSVIEVRNLIRTLASQGTTILLSSHSLNEIDLITSDILFLKDGRVLEEDISIYHKTIYQINLLEGNQEKLAQLNLPYELKGNQLFITDESQHIQQILQSINDLQISFSSISQQKIGAEDRYKIFFGGEL